MSFWHMVLNVILAYGIKCHFGMLVLNVTLAYGIKCHFGIWY